MGSIAVGIGKWLLGMLLEGLSGSAIGDVLHNMTGTVSGSAKVNEIKARVAIETEKEETKRLIAVAQAGTARQTVKMNQPVFWVIIIVMMLPPALMLWSVAIYNILWWEHGIWPQAWAIADFPPSIKPWVEKSIDWLFDPIGVPSTVGAAAVASYLTGRR